MQRDGYAAGVAPRLRLLDLLTCGGRRIECERSERLASNLPFGPWRPVLRCT
jgi:hypothetical protein